MPFRQKVPFEHAIFPCPLASNVIDAARPAVDQTFKWAAGGKQAVERAFDEFARGANRGRRKPGLSTAHLHSCLSTGVRRLPK